MDVQDIVPEYSNGDERYLIIMTTDNVDYRTKYDIY